MAKLSDDSLLKHFGYRQELKRSLGGFSNFAISFSAISILTGGITLYGYGLQTAGPFGMMAGWALVSVASLFIVLCMAELASAFPTAGALYHWASLLGNKHWGWLTGWLNFLGQFALTAGIDYGLTEFLLAVFDLPKESGLRFPIYAAVLLSHALINHYGIRWVALFNDISAWYHVAGFLVLAGALLLWAPKQPMEFLLTKSTTTSFEYGYAFLLGLLQAQWTISGYDASAHVSEETIDTSRRVPLGMMTAVISSAILGLVMLFAITLSIQNMTQAQSAANPFIYIMQTALGESWGNVIVWICVIAMWFCGLAAVTSNSRMLYAFARDGGTPFPGFLARISPVHQTPAPAIWTSTALAFLVALYGQAYAVVTAISTVFLFFSYALPILLGLRAQLRGEWKEKGEFRLGNFSIPCQIVAGVWLLFIVTLFILPPNDLARHATFGTLPFLIVAYFFTKKDYRGAPQVADPRHSAS